MILTFSSGMIEWFVDRNRGVAFALWQGDVTGEDLLESSPQLWRDHPEIGRFNAVHDQLGFSGIIEHRHAKELMRRALAHFGDSYLGIRTAVVTVDRMKHLELKVTEAQAPESRQFRLFTSNRAALEWVMDAQPHPSQHPLWQAGPLPWWCEREMAIS